ncbi:MAG TPA: hypothetical protein VMH78_08955 [Thermoplasmata archaeon]|nr:hypothetical protein [Thermoplasmata archaeon]
MRGPTIAFVTVGFALGIVAALASGAGISFAIWGPVAAAAALPLVAGLLFALDPRLAEPPPAAPRVPPLVATVADALAGERLARVTVLEHLDRLSPAGPPGRPPPRWATDDRILALPDGDFYRFLERTIAQRESYS